MIPIAKATDFLVKMLEGVMSNNDSMVNQGALAIKQLPLPRKGDRVSARTNNEQGLEAFRRSDFTNAAASFLRGVNADPSDQEVVNNLGYALYKSKNFQESVFVLSSALTLNPERASAWFNLGEVLAAQDRQDASVAAFLLAYKYSRNQQKTKELMIAQRNKETDRRIVDALNIVLNRI